MCSMFSEWAVQQHRDTFASYISHHSTLDYFAIAQGQTRQRVRHEMLKVTPHHTTQHNTAHCSAHNTAPNATAPPCALCLRAADGRFVCALCCSEQKMVAPVGSNPNKPAADSGNS